MLAHAHQPVARRAALDTVVNAGAGECGQPQRDGWRNHQLDVPLPARNLQLPLSSMHTPPSVTHIFSRTDWIRRCDSNRKLVISRINLSVQR